MADRPTGLTIVPFVVNALSQFNPGTAINNAAVREMKVKQHRLAEVLYDKLCAEGTGNFFADRPLWRVWLRALWRGL